VIIRRDPPEAELAGGFDRSQDPRSTDRLGAELDEREVGREL